MLSKAAEQCTEYLIKYNKITEQQKSIYKYGFLYPQLCVLELFWFAEYWGDMGRRQSYFYCLLFRYESLPEVIMQALMGDAL